MGGMIDPILETRRRVAAWHHSRSRVTRESHVNEDSAMASAEFQAVVELGWPAVPSLVSLLRYFPEIRLALRSITGADPEAALRPPIRTRDAIRAWRKWAWENHEVRRMAREQGILIDRPRWGTRFMRLARWMPFGGAKR